MSGSTEASDYESDEDNLYLLLNGKKWTEFNPVYIASNPDDYVLLTAPALIAFWAAWLWWAVKDLGSPNPILDGLISHLCSTGEDPR